MQASIHILRLVTDCSCAVLLYILSIQDDV